VEHVEDTRSRPGAGGAPPNVVLRGGPLDGETHALTEFRFRLNLTRDHRTHRYAPTADLDDEYPTLLIFRFVETVG
jgi:hypothetical protein